MKYKNYFSQILSCLVLAASIFTPAVYEAEAQSTSPTRIGVATRTSTGIDVIRVYDGQDILVGDVPIANDFLFSRFIVADFIPNSTASVMAITENEENRRLRVHFINDKGVVVNKFLLGKDVMTLMAIYYDGDAVADLALILNGQNTATVYLNPALTGDTARVEVPLGGRRDIVRLFQNGPDEVGFVSRIDTLTPSSAKKKKKKQQAKIKRRIKKLTKKLTKLQNRSATPQTTRQITKLSGKIDRLQAKLGGGSNSITFSDLNGSTQSLSITSDPGKFLSFTISGTHLGFVKIKNKQVQIFGPGIQTRNFDKQIADRVFVGNYLGTGNDAVVISGDEGTYRVINPITGQVITRTIDITQPSNAPEAPDPEVDPEENPAEETDKERTDRETCERYTILLNEFNDAVNRGDIDRALVLSREIQAIDVPDTCVPSNPNPGGGGPVDGGNDEDDTVFTNGVDRFVPQYYLFKSNTGDFFGPCDRFLDAPDGLGGFLAKNSDGGGIVWLTPDSSYYGDGAMILDFTKLTVKVGSLEYTGIANGGRGHYRLGGDLSSFGKHVFTAVHYYSGERHCWRIDPKGSDRVD